MVVTNPFKLTLNNKQRADYTRGFCNAMDYIASDGLERVIGQSFAHLGGLSRTQPFYVWGYKAAIKQYKIDNHIAD